MSHITVPFINDNLADFVDSVYYDWFICSHSPYADKKMVESEFGLIPANWRITELGEMIESYSKAHSFDKDYLIFLNTSDILAGDFLTEDYRFISDLPGQAKKSIQAGDILFSEIRPANKRYALVSFPAEDYVVSTKLMVLRTTQEEISNLRIYHYLTMKSTLNELHREADGKSGTFPQITFDDNLRHRNIIIADNKTECEFYKLLYERYELELEIRKEISYLKKLASVLLSSLSN